MNEVTEFKEYWSANYGFIELTLTDTEIKMFIRRYSTIPLACNGASDYILSQGDAEVQE